ncbi:MAG: aldo/keto reductase [Treponema sp.]|jgi:aryl-alcohol dehydrogenase-like predicted oxidoreductase|nr:aldo/keto reductase [Treponema sp.]
MKYLSLCAGGPGVSALCLGTVSFGTAISREDAFTQMDLFYGKGGNFFDSARIYADWIPGGHGASEKTLGAWIRERRLRDKVFISTKGTHPDLRTMHIPRMSAVEMRSDLEESLKALQTSYIDLYFLHRDDVSRPVEAILENLEGFRKEGKIRYYGCSNWKLARMEEAEKTAARMDFEGFVCDQLRFGLGDITWEGVGDKTTVLMDSDLFAWHEKTGKTVMAYTSSCNGYFSKKLKGKAVSPGLEAVYGNASNQKLLEKLKTWEEELGVPAAVLVSSYAAAQVFPAVPISSVSSPEQLNDLIRAADFDFPQDMLKEIRTVKKFVV